jgi:hypothetical protein
MSEFPINCPCVLTCVHASQCRRKWDNWDVCERLQGEIEKWAMLKKVSQESAMTVASGKNVDSGFIFKANG